MEIEELSGRTCCEGSFAPQGFVEHGTEAEYVGRWSHVAVGQPFGRHVAERADDAAGLGDSIPCRLKAPCDPEVQKASAPVGPDHDVCGLDVPMHEAGGVRVGETLRDLRNDSRRLAFTEPPVLVHEPGERPTVHELEDDDRAGAIGERVVDGDDRGVRQGGGCSRLRLEALARTRVREQVLVQRLERDQPIESLVMRRPDFRADACSQALPQAVPLSDELARSQLNHAPECTGRSRDAHPGRWHQVQVNFGEGWSRRSDLNRGPAVYETAALPLSYVGGTGRHRSAGPNGPLGAV